MSDLDNSKESSSIGFGHGFWGTLIALLVIVGSLELYGAFTLHKQIQEGIQNEIEQPVLTDSTEATSNSSTSSQWRKTLIDETFRAASIDYKNLNIVLKKRIKISFANSRANLNQRVDDWADWYFSVVGEYTRLGHLGAQAIGKSSLDEYMLDQLSERVFGPAKVFENMSKLNQEVQQRYKAQHQAVITHLTKVMERQKKESDGALDHQERQFLDAHFDRLNDLNHIATVSPLGLVTKLTTLSGVKAGLKYLASKSTVKLVSSGLAKGGAKVATSGAAKGGTKLLTKGAVKAGAKVGAEVGAHGSVIASGVSATALCAPLGLIAPLCGVTAGVATWFAVDKVIVEVDEMINREDFVKQTRVELATIINQLEKETLLDLDRYEKQVVQVIVHDQKQQMNQIPNQTRLVDQLNLPPNSKKN